MLIERLLEENFTLRTILAYSDLPCHYCGLKRADMAGCDGDGTGRCSRHSDMILGTLPERFKFLEGNEHE